MKDVNEYGLTEEQRTLFDKLTPLQKKISLYTIEGKKPAEAHKLAGGKCKNEEHRKDLASQILSNPRVVQFLDSVMKPKEDKAISSAIMSRQEALETLTTMARAKITDTFNLRNIEVEDKDGNVVPKAVLSFKDLNELNEYGATALQEIKVNPSTQEITVKLHDQKAAIKQLSDMMGYNRVADDETAKLTQEERLLNLVSNHAVSDEPLV